MSAATSLVESRAVGAEARLALVEFLLASLEPDRSAAYTLQWLATHLGCATSVCFALSPDSQRLVWLADHGLPDADPADLEITLEDSRHPWVLAAYAAGPTWFETPPPGLPALFGGDPYVAIPLRSHETRAPGRVAEGLLLVPSATARVDAGLWWASEIFGQQLYRLRSRQLLAETRFGRERQLLYSIINAVTDPILLTDPDGRLIIANGPAERLLSVSDDASEGLRRAVQFNNMLFSAALASVGMESAEGGRRELLLVDPADGSDLLFELLTTGLKDPREGSFVVSILRNVTDLGKARQEIEDSYRKLRIAQAETRDERRRVELIIDSVADPILVTDPSGDIVLTNARAARLFTSDGARSEDVQRRVRTNGARFSTFLSALLSSAESTRSRGEFELLDPETGAPIPFEAIAGTIVSQQAELTWVVTILHDRTEEVERVRLYEQLQRASQELERKVQEATAELAEQNELLRRQHIALAQASSLKSQFLATVSHEVRTPLNAILGYTHMLLHGVSGTVSAAQQRYLERIDSNARHLLALISDILDISRIESGRMPVHVTRFRLPELINEVVAELEPIIRRSNLAFSVDLAPRLPAVRSDRQKVKQIVLNLLSNALKFTPRGSVRIAVACDPKARLVTMAVSDTGIGIPEADHERVFEDFQQVDRPARPLGGTGLGLAICRRLAALLSGRVVLESTVGRGSTFALELPIRPKR